MPLLAVRGNGPAGAYGFGAASGAADAMTAIASTTLGTNTATITFSSIPSTYDDLYLVLYGRSTATFVQTQLRVRFNSDTATNYSGTFMEGSGVSASSLRYTSVSSIYISPIPAASATSNIFGAVTMNILNYNNTSNNKTMLARSAVDRNGAGTTTLGVGLWRSTNAITSIELASLDSGDLVAGTVAALYGIKKAA